MLVEAPHHQGSGALKVMAAGSRGRNRTAIVGHSCTLARSPLVTDPDSDRGRGQPWAGRQGFGGLAWPADGGTDGLGRSLSGDSSGQGS